MAHYEYKMNEKGDTFYRLDWIHKTYSIVSEEEFYKKSKYKKSDLQKLLKSVYPTQGNNYLLLKKDGQTYPVDYKLVPLVKYLWSHGVETMGWNQPDQDNFGFISAQHYMKDQSSLAFLQEIVGSLPYKVLNFFNEDATSLEKQLKEQEKLLNKGYLVLIIYSNFVSISFNESSMKKLYKKLHLKLNEERYPGAGILWSGALKEFRKVKA